MLKRLSKSLMTSAVAAAGSIGLFQQKKAFCATTSFYVPLTHATLNTFRGSMSEYAKKFPDFNATNIQRVEIVGKTVGGNGYNPSETVNDSEMRNFMGRIIAHRIKELDLLGVTLGKGCGYEISLALKKEKCSLEQIALTTSQLDKFDLTHFLESLETNSSLNVLIGRSSSIEPRQWSEEEISALRRVIGINNALELIVLQNNQIQRIEDAASLITTYNDNVDKKPLPSIGGLEIYDQAISINSATVKSGEFKSILAAAEELTKEKKVREKYLHNKICAGIFANTSMSTILDSKNLEEINARFVRCINYTRNSKP